MSDANSTQVGGRHYKDRIEVWDAVEAWGCGFLDGNVIKYLARFRRKGGLEDLHKARHYLTKLIEVETPKNREHWEMLEKAMKEWSRRV